MKKQLNVLKGIKCNESLKVLFQKLGFEGDMIEETFIFMSKPIQITNEGQIPNALGHMIDDIHQLIDRYTNEGSGWGIKEVISHGLRINRYSPLEGRSYIPLPESIQNRKATVNIKNKDDKCFIYSLGRALDPNPETKNLERVSKHLKDVCDSLGLSKIECPVTVPQMAKIEEEYKVGISLFGLTGANQVYPNRLGGTKYEKEVDLLIVTTDDIKESKNGLFTKEKVESNTTHYVWIKNFNKLCSVVTKHEHKKYFCKRCLQHFNTEDKLSKHNENCMLLTGCQGIEMPKPGVTVKFNSFQETVKIPFVIYADLESILQAVNDSTIVVDDGGTTKLNKHIACSYGYKVVCIYDSKLSKPYKTYRGVDSLEQFFTDIFREEDEIAKKLVDFARNPIIMTDNQKLIYEVTKKCYICKNEFTEKKL